MAKTIDERIVQMTFNNKDFEKNANQTISTLDKLKGALDFSGASNGLSELQKTGNNVDFSDFYRSITTISDQFSVMKEIAIGAFREIGVWAAQTGAQLIESLTIKPFQISWSKYDEIIASEQSIMSAVEGKTDKNGIAYDMDAVVERVDKLKWFADETSYSITQMTNALGQFTASGQDLDESVDAVMGIANACADAGVNAVKAESAFYAFSKAIGGGKMTLGYWNTQLKTSGLSNSERFRKTLLETAAAMGTVKKTADGTYYSLEKGEEITIANLTEYLNEGIFTSDVLIAGMKKYSDTTEKVREIQFGNIESLTDLYKVNGKTMSAEMKAWADDVEKNGTTASDVIANLKKAYEELGLEVPQSLNALRRAQEAISFTQAIDATAEAVTSQFSNIYHYMVGNYEEAKELWSDLADKLNEWFVGPLYDLADAFAITKNLWTNRDNALTQFIGDEESATQLIAIFRAFASVIDNIRSRIDDILEMAIGDLPTIEDTGKAIFNFLEKVRANLWKISNYLNGITENANNQYVKSNVEQLVKLGAALVVVVRTVTNALKTVWNSFVIPLKEKLKPILSDIVDIFGNLASMVLTIDPTNMSTLEDILTTILNILDPVINALGSVVSWIKDLTSQNGELTIFEAIFTGISNVFKYIANVFNGSTSIFQDFSTTFGSAFDKISGSISEFLTLNSKGVSSIIEGGFLGLLAFNITSLINKIKNLDFNIGDLLQGFFKGADNSIEPTVKLIDNVANALLKLAASLLIISFIDSDKMGQTLWTLGLTLMGLLGVMTVMEQMSGRKVLKSSIAFTVLSAGLLVLAGALKVISSISVDEMGNTLRALTIILSEMYVFMALLNMVVEDDGLFSNDSKKLINIGKALKTMGVGLIAISVALAIVSSLDPDGLTQAVFALGLVLGEIMIFMASAKEFDKKKLIAASSAIKSIGLALIEIALALKIMSSINLDQMKVALLGTVGALLSLYLFIKGISKMSGNSANTLAVGAAIIGMGLALIEIAAALKLMSTINFEDMCTALVGVVGALGSLFLFVKLVKKAGVDGGELAAFAAGILIFTTALIPFAAALAVIGAMKWESLGKAGAAIAGLMVIFGTSAALLSGTGKFILIFSASLLVFGIALDVTAAAMYKMVGAMALLTATGTNFSSVFLTILGEVVASLVAMLPEILIGIIKGVVEVLAQIKDLVVRILEVLIEALAEILPKLTELIMTALTGLIEAVYEIIPAIVKLGVAIIEAILLGIEENIYQLTLTATEIISEFIRALGDGLEDIVQALCEFVIDAINALAEGIRGNGSGFGEAFGNLASAIIEAIINGITSLASTLWESGKGLLNTIISAFTGEDANAENAQAGETVVTGVKEGMEDTENDLLSTADEIGTNLTDELNREEDAAESGNYTGMGFINSLESYVPTAWSTGYDIGSNAILGMNAGAGVQSPSKYAAESGMYIIKGLVNGLRDNMDEVEEAGTDSGSAVISALSSAIQAANSILDEDLNPVITPVLDLSNVQANAGSISSLLGARQSYNLAIQNGGKSLALAGGIGSIQSGKAVTLNATFNVNANKEITRTDVQKWSSWLVDEINDSLGRQIR